MKVITVKVGPLRTNCYLLADADGLCVVVDPGGDASVLESVFLEKGLTPTGILLTHGHFDHTGAVRPLQKKYPEVSVYIHPKDTSPQPSLYTFLPVEGQCYCKEGTTLQLGAYRVSVLEMPGHSPGSVSFLIEDGLFCGDTLLDGSCGRTDLPGGDPESLRRSLRRLAAFEKDLRIFPGHYAPSTLEIQRKSNPFLREVFLMTERSVM